MGALLLQAYCLGVKGIQAPGDAQAAHAVTPKVLDSPRCQSHRIAAEAVAARCLEALRSLNQAEKGLLKQIVVLSTATAQLPVHGEMGQSAVTQDLRVAFLN